jgi:hypothetical protein
MLSLLQERIIDAWITSDLHDLPDSAAFVLLPLWNWPGELAVHPCHPLARERGLLRSDLDRFPSLILPDNLYPGLARVVHDKGFGKASRPQRYDLGSWDGMSEDAVTIVYGSCLSMDVNPNLNRLDWDLGLTGGEVLIVLADCVDQPALALLLEDLRGRQSLLQQRFPQLVGHL